MGRGAGQNLTTTPDHSSTQLSPTWLVRPPRAAPTNRTEVRNCHNLSGSMTTTYYRACYRNAVVNGAKIFYRQAGSAEAPTLLLLHGFPSSSHMFRDRLPGDSGCHPAFP